MYIPGCNLCSKIDLCIIICMQTNGSAKSGGTLAPPAPPTDTPLSVHKIKSNQVFVLLHVVNFQG